LLAIPFFAQMHVVTAHAISGTKDRLYVAL
jgi:hypothetical protein